MNFNDLPQLGAPLDSGIFAGVITNKDDTHCAVVLLPERATGLTWKKAMNWAEKLEAELPSRPIAAMLFANVKASLPDSWHWTSEQYDASYAWFCHFGYGTQLTGRKSYEGSAVAVRRIALKGTV
jgi:hypothetical protein